MKKLAELVAAQEAGRILLYKGEAAQLGISDLVKYRDDDWEISPRRPPDKWFEARGLVVQRCAMANGGDIVLADEMEPRLFRAQYNLLSAKRWIVESVPSTFWLQRNGFRITGEPHWVHGTLIAGQSYVWLSWTGNWFYSIPSDEMIVAHPVSKAEVMTLESFPRPFPILRRAGTEYQVVALTGLGFVTIGGEQKGCHHDFSEWDSFERVT